MRGPVGSGDAEGTLCWRSTFGQAVWAALVGVVYASIVAGLDRFDWGRGHLRALVLGLTAVVLISLRPAPAARIARQLSTAMAILLLALLTVRACDVVQAYRANHYRPVDIAATTVAAIAAVHRDESPYSTAVDPRPETTAPSGYGFFDGYKYGPLNAWLYSPLTRVTGVAGIYLTNFVFYVAAVALLVALGKTLSPQGDLGVGLGASLLFVATSLVWRESAVQGVNDGVQVAFLLGAVLLRVKGEAMLASVVVGAALASKLMPAAALLLALLPLPRRMAFVTTAALTAIPLFMTQFPAAPKEMIANLVLFHLNREVDSTAVRYFLPPILAAGWPLLVGGVLAVLTVRYLIQRRWGSAAIVRFLALFFAVFYLTGNAHRNYLVWFVPFLALEAATVAFRARSTFDATPPSS